MTNAAKRLYDEVAEIPQHKQVQFALEEQIVVARLALNRLGLYDVADYLRGNDQ